MMTRITKRLHRLTKMNQKKRRKRINKQKLAKKRQTNQRIQIGLVRKRLKTRRKRPRWSSRNPMLKKSRISLTMLKMIIKQNKAKLTKKG